MGTAGGECSMAEASAATTIDDAGQAVYSSGCACLSHAALMFFWSFGQQVNGVWQDGEDALEALFDCFGAAGEIDNQRATACSRYASREHTKGGVLQAGGTHGLGNTGSFPFNHRLCRLWRNIAWRQSGAAGGEYEVQVLPVTPLAQGRLDLVALVGNDCPGSENGIRHLCHHAADALPACILPRALRAAITDGEYANANHLTTYPCGVNSRIIAPIWRREP